MTRFDMKGRSNEYEEALCGIGNGTGDGASCVRNGGRDAGGVGL